MPRVSIHGQSLIRRFRHSLQTQKELPLCGDSTQPGLQKDRTPSRGCSIISCYQVRLLMLSSSLQKSWKRGSGVRRATLKATGAPAHMQMPNVGMLCDDFMKYKSQMNFL